MVGGFLVIIVLLKPGGQMVIMIGPPGSGKTMLALLDPLKSGNNAGEKIADYFCKHYYFRFSPQSLVLMPVVPQGYGLDISKQHNVPLK